MAKNLIKNQAELRHMKYVDYFKAYSKMFDKMLKELDKNVMKHL